MSIDIRVISIGSLGCHPLRGEKQESRPGHATTTLIRTDDACILIDPSLPVDHLTQRLDERAGISPDRITHVFLTDLRPDRRRGIEVFADAQWLTGEKERDAYGEAIRMQMHDTKIEFAKAIE